VEEEIERERDIDLPSVIGSKWRLDLERRWQEAVRVAERGWPEATRILYVIGAELRSAHPRTGRRLSLDSSTSAVMAVLK
jgi:hypothetical protein